VTYRLALKLTKAGPAVGYSYCRPVFATREEAGRYRNFLERKNPGMIAQAVTTFSRSAWVTATFEKGRANFKWIAEEPIQ
jgi:hypothetical protein